MGIRKRIRTKMKLFAALSAFSASVDACGGTVNEYQSISSPGHYYDNDLDCTWNIELGDVPSFTIVNNLFDVEYNSYCGFDFLKLIDGNGYEQNFCGETYSQYYSSSSSSGSYSSSGSSSSSSSSGYSGRKRRRKAASGLLDSLTFPTAASQTA